MTTVHPHPHPRAHEVLIPSNEEIAKKFGQVRVEDWDDRVAGETWSERHQRGAGPEVGSYLHSTVLPGCEGSRWPQQHEVVRCHSTTTGELILLHDDWL